MGRVRFVVTDGRSERSERSMLGAAQLQWLLGELQRSPDHALIVWVNATPWIGAARPGADGWAGFPTNRAGSPT